MKLYNINNFNSSLADKPYCSDDLSLGLKIRPKQQALTHKYIQANDNYIKFLVIDCDHVNAMVWEDGRLPKPNFIIRNKENGHFHIIWALSSPIFRDYINKAKNLGVLLVDCKAWREQKIQNKLFDTANQYVSKVPYGDQCILNMVLKDKIGFAEVIYNYQVGALRELKLKGVEHKMPKLPETQLPYIIHYTSTEKPWHRDKSMMHRDKYWFYHNLEWCEISEKWEK
ncbi:glycosyltransferase [Ursidibacter arcticus]